MADDLTQAGALLEELIKKLGVEATITLESTDPPMLAVATDDPAPLIGHRGDAMKALQHILRVMMARQGTELPVLVDVEGYRAKQQEQLQELAARKAEEVRETGRLAMLPPMSSYERRLVHMALAERDDVVTESVGEGAERRLMIKKKE